MTRRLWIAAILVWLVPLCACESGPRLDTSFSGERVDVLILGEGFVRFEDERLPVEEFVYLMRRRLREAGDGASQRVWVHVDVDPDGGVTAQQDFNRVLDYLQAMGVRQIEYL